MCNVICVANLQEKTGRTSTAVNFAASLALLEKKVLLVDCDANGQASFCLGILSHAYDFGLDDLLSGIVGGRAVVRQTAMDFLDIIPPGHSLNEMEKKLAQNPDKEKVLSIVLSTFKERYDYIIFDTPGQKNLMTISALVSCDSLMIPALLGPRTLDGLYSLLGFASDVRKKIDEPLKIAGILFMDCNSLQDVDNYYQKNEHKDFKHAICSVTIPGKPLDPEVDGATAPSCLVDIKSDYSEAFLDLSFEFLYRETRNERGK
ncbi:MAG: AAA family ATPase [Proteobacteria bacterium]|nr:AAA family ATPase [Pseudomonadota bacterium]